MRRYRDNVVLIVLNILLEYLILFGTYILCALVRLYVPIPYVAKFYSYVIWKFIPAILIVSAIMVAIYMVLGDYNSIHFRNKKRIFIESFLVSLLGGFGMSMTLFFFKGDVFSRVLLLMLLVMWPLMISVKRLLFELLANTVFANKISSVNVLLVGTSNNARRYYEGLRKDKSSRYNYVGYIGSVESKHIDGYLGDYACVTSIISERGVQKVVIAEDDINKVIIKDVISLCSVYGIEVVIIPIYADYVIDEQRIRTENGVHLISVNANVTSDILGVNISVTDMDKTLSEIEDNLNKWKGKYICVSNVHTTVMAHDDASYRAVQNGAVMALPDGGPLSSYSRSEGKSEAKRVTGPDLMQQVLKKSSETQWKHFFYGSSEKTLSMLRDKIERAYPGAQVVGMISPPYRDITPEEDAEYIKAINDSGADFLWVGLGAPKQEIWMSAHKDKVNALMIGVGAAFDYESGNLKRAPKWMQKCNLEWLYRFMQEPRRLFKRYFVTNIKFLWLTRR